MNGSRAGARTSVRVWNPDFSPAKTAALLLALALVACAPKPSAQCGVASLANVLARAGCPASYAALLRETPVEAGHTTFADLARVARGRGVWMTGYRLPDASALESSDRGVVELLDDHFVALLGREDGAFLIVDSPDGKLRAPEEWSAARLEAEWTGNVLLVERPAKERKELTRSPLRGLWATPFSNSKRR